MKIVDLGKQIQGQFLLLDSNGKYICQFASEAKVMAYRMQLQKAINKTTRK